MGTRQAGRRGSRGGEMRSEETRSEGWGWAAELLNAEPFSIQQFSSPPHNAGALERWSRTPAAGVRRPETGDAETASSQTSELRAQSSEVRSPGHLDQVTR